MTIVYDKLLSLKFPVLEHEYTSKDSILYALGIGLGLDPDKTAELPFVYEGNQKALPTQACVLAHPGFWLRDLDTGVDWKKALHGEHELVINKPLAPSGTVVGHSRIVDAIDKGPGRGALLLYQRNLVDKATGDLIATINQKTFCRADGGFGGPERPALPPTHELPGRKADCVCDLTTSTQAALIYRLSGDLNPLHADPAVAQAGGFQRPILHGLATFGVVGHAVLKTVCDYRVEAIKKIAVRFTAPVYPGETFRTEIWRDGDIVSFQVRSIERDVVAVSNGRVELGL